jgi:hypothetical protein
VKRTNGCDVGFREEKSTLCSESEMHGVLEYDVITDFGIILSCIGFIHVNELYCTKNVTSLVFGRVQMEKTGASQAERPLGTTQA